MSNRIFTNLMKILLLFAFSKKAKLNFSLALTVPRTGIPACRQAGNQHFVPRTGIEPARPKTVTRPSTWRVYQFRHLGKIFDFPQVTEAFAAVWPGPIEIQNWRCKNNSIIEICKIGTVKKHIVFARHKS